MNLKQLVLHADFDGTLFDPSIRVFTTPIFNQLTVRLMKKHKAMLMLNTGRPIWNWFSNLQLVITGMKKADVVITGCGTTIFWKKGLSLIEDAEWSERIKKTGWNKERIKTLLTPYLVKEGATLFDTANPYMTRVWVYNKKVKDLNSFISQLSKALPHTKILLTEQILLPNSTDVFSGYLLFIPAMAGKDKAAEYVTQKLNKQARSTQETIYVGDAIVDVPLLTYDTSLTNFSYGINPTPLAKERLNTQGVPVVLGSPPQIIHRIIKNHLQINLKERNSGLRQVITPVLSFIDSRIYPGKSPDQLSLLGLELVKKAVKDIRPLQTITLIQGFFLDAFDGIRARKHPEQTSKHGQLIDVYADRSKEFTQLSARNQYDAALSCFLPSIARAQAEAMGIIVPEIDVAGGTSLNRSRKLIFAYLLYSLGARRIVQKIDQGIFQANLASYYNRRKYAALFQWTNLKEYDKQSVIRLIFLIKLLQTQIKRVEATDANLKRMIIQLSKVPVEKLEKDLKLSLPQVQNYSIKDIEAL